MAINESLLEILVCPEDKTRIRLLDPSSLNGINNLIKEGRVKNRRGEIVAECLEAALIREDGRYMYAVRQDIPIMLIDEALVVPRD